MSKKKSKIDPNETTDTYASEGMTIGLIIGGFFFIVFLLGRHASYGAVFLVICVVAGLIIGLMQRKPPIGDEKLNREIKSYKKLDKERNAFFLDRSVKKYDKNVRTPVIRKNLANGERVAGFLLKGSGRFEEKMLIRDEKDLREFMRQYGISSEEDLKKGEE
jgi:hypothetical protein